MKSLRNWYFVTVVCCGVLTLGPVSTLGKSRNGTPVTLGRISFLKSWKWNANWFSRLPAMVQVWLATKS